MRITHGIVLLLAVCGFLAGGTEAAVADRPNFVIFITDDQNWNDLGAYGHPSIRTPHMDQLAKDGLLFRKAFLTTSSCSPSRASILTGRYPTNTGAPDLHMPVPADQRLVTQPLREAGYYTASVGKWHLGGQVRDQVDLVNTGGRPSGAGEWLSVLQERPEDQPFFLWLASVDPHRPYEQDILDQPHQREDVIVPPHLPDTPEVRDDLRLYYDEIARVDGYIGRIREELERQGVADNTFILFLSDNGRPFPGAKTRLTDPGIRTPFIVVYPGEVQPGTTTRSVVSAVDIAPTVLELAGVEIAESFQGQSFVPILEDPQARIREHAFAEQNWHDFRAYARGVRSEQYTYIRNFVPEVPATPPADALRSPSFRTIQARRLSRELTPAQLDYFIVPRPEEELYHTQSDPHAINNVADDPAYAEVLATMRQELNDWFDRTETEFPGKENLQPDTFDRETGEQLENAE